MTIDLNCDMGESYGRYRIGNDAAVFPYITSANIACGFHAGDPLSIERTIQLAVQHKVQIGAHPGYPDLMGFGRRKMHIPAPDLKAIVKYQVAAIKGLAESHGGKLSYVKPHGALYNSMVKDAEEAAVVVEAILAIDENLAIMGLAGSRVKAIVEAKGARFIAEAFADRRYETDGSLMSRQKEGAVLHDPEQIAKQVLQIVQEKKVTTADGIQIKMDAQSICIHGDNPAALMILQHLDKSFQSANIQKESF